MTLFWIAWLLAFLVVEGIALARHRAMETFSAQVWAVERRVPVARFLVAGFLVWLIVHFATGGLT